MLKCAAMASASPVYVESGSWRHEQLLCSLIISFLLDLPCCCCRSDFWPLGLTIALGITNGHGQSLAMMHAPSTLPGGFTRDRCGPILTLAFTVGCMLGSIAAFGITYTFQAND